MIVAGTGHRPDKLGGYTEHTKTWTRATALAGLTMLEPDKVISGMAQGWDQAIAWAAIDLGIPFVAAIPCENQHRMWPKAAQEEYYRLLSKADTEILVTAGNFASYKMQLRNEWMVDHANYILALWDGSSGGTANCIKYAEKQGKPITNLWSITQ